MEHYIVGGTVLGVALLFALIGIHLLASALIALTVLLVYLSYTIIRLRNEYKILLGDGDNETLRRAIRAHANFIEYTPWCMLLFFACTFGGANFWWMLLLLLVLVTGRLLHAYGLLEAETWETPEMRARVYGMMLTGGFIALSCLTLLVLAIRMM